MLVRKKWSQEQVTTEASWELNQRNQQLGSEVLYMAENACLYSTFTVLNWIRCRISVWSHWAMLYHLQVCISGRFCCHVSILTASARTACVSHVTVLLCPMNPGGIINYIFSDFITFLAAGACLSWSLPLITEQQNSVLAGSKLPQSYPQWYIIDNWLMQYTCSVG